MVQKKDTDSIISNLKNSENYIDQIKHIEHISPRFPKFAENIDDLKFHPSIIKYLTDRSIKLYVHQYEAIKILKSGKNMIITSSTSSGKTLIYMLTILDEILKNPKSTAILLYPRKALSRDQLQKFFEVCEGVGLKKQTIGIYDGDTPSEQKDFVLATANIVITNPYAFHQYLKSHQRWGRIFRNLKYFIIDEVHMYRGIFGSNMAYLFRRLNRILDTISMANFTYGMFSATIGNPLELAQNLVGRTVQLVNIDTSGQRGKNLIIWEPPFIKEMDGYMGLKSQARLLFKGLIPEDIQTLMFLRTRFEAELFAKSIKQDLSQISDTSANLIMAYRAGISPEDRRKIEHSIRGRELLGITSTNALEVGIDIGDLDSVILGGFPGSVNSFWQQAGRAGRTKFDVPLDQQQEALIFYVPKINPLDMYYAGNFQELLDTNHEDAVVDLDNILILKNHLWCAVHEKAISNEDQKYFGTNIDKALEMLEKEKKVVKVGNKHQAANRNDFPPKSVMLDNLSGDQYQLILIEENGSSTILTTEDRERVFFEIYPETVYLYMTETYHVISVDHENKIVKLKKEVLPYYTRVRMSEEIQINAELEHRQVNDFTIHFGDVTVYFTPVEIQKRDLENDNIIGGIEMEHPQTYQLDTKSLWWTFPCEYALLTLKSKEAIEYLSSLDTQDVDIEAFVKKNSIEDPDFKAIKSEEFAGGIHAMEHACISMIPYFQLCDRNDIGGVSSPNHDDTHLPTVFIYDGYQGGIGISQRVFHKLENLFEKTEKMIALCKCQSGCPACVYSPKCGNNNKPIDKKAAQVLLKLIKYKKK
jgi:DEAD/DEAH box helicase domain-containing protein